MNKNSKSITTPLGLKLQSFDDIRTSIVEGFSIEVNTDSGEYVGKG